MLHNKLLNLTPSLKPSCPSQRRACFLSPELLQQLPKHSFAIQSFPSLSFHHQCHLSGHFLLKDPCWSLNTYNISTSVQGPTQLCPASSFTFPSDTYGPVRLNVLIFSRQAMPFTTLCFSTGSSSCQEYY